MNHKHYYEISANNNFDLGLKRGELFGDIARETLKNRKSEKNWQAKVKLSKDYLKVTPQYFPQ